MALETFAASIQDRAQTPDRGLYPPFVPLFLMEALPTDQIAPWWSLQRDVDLRRFWRRDGLLASTIYTMQAIIAGTGWTVEGDKPRLLAKARQPLDQAEFGQGLAVLTKKVIEDWLTQDNGYFMELLGPGDVNQALTVPPVGICHLDAGRCWRSPDPEYPVWYLAEREYKWRRIHWTRVAYGAPNPSAIELARGLGYCAVSRVAALSTIMQNVIRYKSEKTGGRHTRGLLYGNIPVDVVERSIEMAEQRADDRSEIRYSAYPYIGAPLGQADPVINLLELAGLPDGFDWRDELTLYLYILALALGLDARELWPATTAGATKADAEVQHRKAMRKGVGDALGTLELIFNQRLLPEGVTFTFKPKDSEEDQEQATIEKTRTETATGFVDAGITTPYGALVYLVNAGVLPKEYLANADLAPLAPSEQEEPEPETTPVEETPPPPPGGSEPIEEDETEVEKGRKQGEGEPVVLDPQQVGPVAPETDLPGAAVTKTDIERELELWRAHPLLKEYAPPRPSEVGDYDKLPDGLASKAHKTQRWLWRRKQAIPMASREALLTARTTIFTNDVQAICGRFARGEITLAQWETQMRGAIKGVHTSAGAIGRGAWQDMTFSDWGRVGAEVRRQYSYLHVWAEALQARVAQGLTVSENALVARAGMYGSSASATYSRMVCIDIGIDPSVLPAQPGDGTTECYTNCRCNWRFVVIDRGKGDWDAYWELNPAEHCDTCRARAAAWSPFQIRGGEPLPGQVHGGLFR